MLHRGLHASAGLHKCPGNLSLVRTSLTRKCLFSDGTRIRQKLSKFLDVKAMAKGFGFGSLIKEKKAPGCVSSGSLASQRDSLLDGCGLSLDAVKTVKVACLVLQCCVC